jgi:hypothetical protein
MHFINLLTCSIYYWKKVFVLKQRTPNDAVIINCVINAAVVSFK